MQKSSFVYGCRFKKFRTASSFAVPLIIASLERFVVNQELQSRRINAFGSEMLKGISFGS